MSGDHTSPSAPPPRKLTTAGFTYEENSRRLKPLPALILFITNGAVEVEAQRATMKPEDAAAAGDLSKQILSMAAKVDPVLAHWYLVMFVTFAETFLQDVLAETASADPQVIRGDRGNGSRGTIPTIDGSGEPSGPPLEDVLRAESLDELKAIALAEWARRRIDSGGPERWSRMLKGLGVTFPAGVDVARLEEIWGVRHVIVHRAGSATTDFIRRHPSFGARPGQQLELMPRVADDIRAIDAFVVAIDSSLGQRIAAARLRETPTEGTR